MAVERIADLKKEAGRISSSELKKLVVRVYYYLCVVALQYLAPLVLLLFCAILLKTLGDFSVARIFGFEFPSIHGATTARVLTTTSQTVVITDSSGATVEGGANTLTDDPDSAESIAVNIIDTASQFSQSLARFKLVFTPMCFRGLLSFAAWWICTAWFTTSAFGLVYYSYFRE